MHTNVILALQYPLSCQTSTLKHQHDGPHTALAVSLLVQALRYAWIAAHQSRQDSFPTYSYMSIAQFMLKSSVLFCVLAVCHYDARGSSAARTPSPIMLSPRSVINRAAAGKKASHQAMRKYCCAWLNSSPQLGVGGGSPKPK
jgi:hypothetical protein